MQRVAPSFAYRGFEQPRIERFDSRDKPPYWFTQTKRQFCIKIEFNSPEDWFGTQYGRRFFVLEHQYGRRFFVLEHQYGPVTFRENALLNSCNWTPTSFAR